MGKSQETFSKKEKEKKRIKKKQDLIKHFKFPNYYQLKEKIGVEQIYQYL